MCVMLKTRRVLNVSTAEPDPEIAPTDLLHLPGNVLAPYCRRPRTAALSIRDAG